MTKKAKKGMEGVVVADSEICTIDGQKGSLRYRGIHINDLAEHSTYEETVYLLWFGELPDQAQLDEFTARMAAEREIGDVVWNVLVALPPHLSPMEALRTAISVFASCDPVGEDQSHLDNAIRLTARMPTVIAHWHRHKSGKERVLPDPELSHAANFLYMLRDERPSALQEKAMDLALVLMAEHEFNASTFAARVTASTLSDMYSAITTAIGTLKGPLHGGANQRAMQMLTEINELDNVEPYIADALNAKRRIMGFGHRIYKTIDPRAVHLRAMLQEVCNHSEDQQWCVLAQAVADVVEEKKGLYPNVDFFAAPLLHVLGVPVHLFTAVFAMSRVAGWTAHVMEQYDNNRLLRPLSAYVGPPPRDYVPLEQRANGREQE